MSQVNAKDLVASIGAWLAKLDVTLVQYLGAKSKDALIQAIGNTEPSSLAGLAHVWFLHAVISAGVFYINIVQTEQAQ